MTHPLLMDDANTIDFGMLDLPAGPRHEDSRNFAALAFEKIAAKMASPAPRVEERCNPYDRVVNVEPRAVRTAIFYRVPGAKKWSRWCGRVARHGTEERVQIEALLARHPAALIALTTTCPEASWDPCR
jgi:hypothetical protein